MAELLTTDQAATLAGVTDRTLREWAAKGKATRHQAPDGRVYWNREEIAAIRPDPEPTGDEPEAPETAKAGAISAEEAVLRARLHGAHLAATLHARRRQDALRERERADAERDRLAAHVDFLSAQLAAARDAERELRLLLAHSSQALTSERERHALPAEGASRTGSPLPEGRRWWQRWWG